jgi:hypothetical protein
MALNWTITIVSENTMPVSAIMPEAIEEHMVMAAAGLMLETILGKK